MADGEPDFDRTIMDLERIVEQEDAETIPVTSEAALFDYDDDLRHVAHGSEGDVTTVDEFEMAMEVKEANNVSEEKANQQE